MKLILLRLDYIAVLELINNEHFLLIVFNVCGIRLATFSVWAVCMYQLVA